MVQSRGKRIKNEIQKIKKTLKNLNTQIFIKECAGFDMTYERQLAKWMLDLVNFLKRELKAASEDLLAELEDEAFWLCTARAEKHKGIEMW